MKRDKFEMGTGQAHEVSMAFDRNGWTAADVHKLCGGDILAKVLDVVRGRAQFAPTTFESLRAAYDGATSSTFTEDHFPLVDDGTGNKEILEYSPARLMSGFNVLHELKHFGFKPIGVRRAMEYVIANPDNEKKHTLVAIGAQWKSRRDDSTFVPCFSWDGRVRHLNLGLLINTYGTDCRFLVVRDKEEGEPKKHIIDTDADPFIPEGWKVESHQKRGQMEWDPAKVSLYLSKRQQNSRTIDGYELGTELGSQPVLNACVLDYLLAHPALIPEKWKGKNVYFWGTIYRSSGDNLNVRFLYWNDGRWRWHFDWLINDWPGIGPAAVSIA